MRFLNTAAAVSCHFDRCHDDRGDGRATLRLPYGVWLRVTASHRDVPCFHYILCFWFFSSMFWCGEIFLNVFVFQPFIFVVIQKNIIHSLITYNSSSVQPVMKISTHRIIFALNTSRFMFCSTMFCCPFFFVNVFIYVVCTKFGYNVSQTCS